MSDIVAVIMAGGQGQRFWPLSTAERPKQFLDLEQSGRTLVQATYDRLLPLTGGPERILVATGQRYVELVREQLPDLPADNLIVEPVGRDSGPAIALASLLIHQRFGDVVAAFFSSDHSVGDNAAFADTIAAAAQLAREKDGLVTIGIAPSRAATGFGYIEQGPASGPGFKVARFVEKPNARTAEHYIHDGRYLWNAGIFVWTTARIHAELNKHAPMLSEPLGMALATGNLDEVFPMLPKVSIDYALMEKSDCVYVVPGHFRWDDIGDWEALERHLGAKAPDANTVLGRHVGLETSGNIIYTEGPDDAIITLGVKDMVIVKRGNTVLLVPKNRVQDIKQLIADERIAGLEFDD